MIKEWAANTTVNLEVLEEGALAMAQATMQNAINAAGFTRAELSRHMGRPRSFVTRILKGNHNLTVKTLARALGSCGYELEFNTVALRGGWSYQPPSQMVVEGAPPETGGARPRSGRIENTGTDGREGFTEGWHRHAGR